jgi:hypothetical protein
LGFWEKAAPQTDADKLKGKGKTSFEERIKN